VAAETRFNVDRMAADYERLFDELLQTCSKFKG
jgi:hypothetical protein